MLSVNPPSSGSSASSANDNSNIAAFVSQNSIGILAVVPSAPTSVVATSGNTSLAVTWVAPTSTGGSAITEYLVKYSSNNGAAGPWKRFFPSPRLPITASPCTVTGLANGTSYIIKVIAKNTIGFSPPANSAPATPATVPGRPTSVVATSGNTSLAVTWTAPASTGGSAIINYQVKYSSNNGSTWKNFVHPLSTVPSLTVTGLANGTSYVIKVIAVNAIGISPPSANSAPARPLAAALTPTFGATTATATGFTVLISNYDAAYTWAGTATASGSVVVSGTGLVTVTGLAAGTSSTATITTTRTGYTGGSAPFTATSLNTALTPTFGTPTATADGFTVSITNYDSTYTWAGTATASGTVAINSTTGVITVTGVAANTLSTATITTTRTGYAGGSNTVAETSLNTALTPTFGTPVATANGFRVLITNFNASYTWAGTATASGTVVIDSNGFVMVTNVAPGTSSTATITTTRTGYTGGTANVTGNSLMLMSMVTVGNPGNAADTASSNPGYGAVSYSYQIGTYDVTGSQYTAFLNAVGSTDTYGLYNASMGTDSQVAQISRSGTAGTYTYAVMNGTGSRPISYVSWFDCARFSNWMSNGQLRGAQNDTTTENGAYYVNGAISGSNPVVVNTTNPNTGTPPTYRIPLENQWYKAAYYSPNYGGTGVGGYYAYATKSDTAPVAATASNNNPNQANYKNAIGHATDVGSFSGSGSFYDTFDQTGNVYQWNDFEEQPGPSRGFRGGGWTDSSFFVSSDYRDFNNVDLEKEFIGFRLASPVTTTLTPTFGATTATADGFTVQITNYDTSYTWAGTATASGTLVVSSTGLVTVIGVAANTSSTATITTMKLNTFGTATVTATSLAMIMVTVGDAGNAPDTTGFGAVPYAYQIGAHDVTGSQYTAFLNAVGSTDPYGLYNAYMGTDTNVAQISQLGSSGSYTYAVMNITGQRPISYVSWFDSARFSNWMSNGQPRGAQSNTTTENGAYNLNGATSGNAVAANATNPNTNSAPTYRIPLENEWYKAAYYKGGSTNAGYWTYATQSDTAPDAPTAINNSPNQANYNNAIGHSTDVGSFKGSGSSYGTFDQTGNVWQWNDLDGTTGSSRTLRGGGWYDVVNIYGVSSQSRLDQLPWNEIGNFGFRLAGPV